MRTVWTKLFFLLQCHTEFKCLTWVKGQLSSISKISLYWHSLVCKGVPSRVCQEMLFWNVRIFIAFTMKTVLSHRGFNLMLKCYSLFYIYLFILAVMQHGYDTVRGRMVLVSNRLSDWADPGSWWFQFLNFRFHQILWMLRGLWPQKGPTSCKQEMHYVQKVQNAEFCNTCCNNTVIFSVSTNSWNRGAVCKRGYLSRPTRKLHLRLKNVEVMRYQTIEVCQVSQCFHVGFVGWVFFLYFYFFYFFYFLFFFLEVLFILWTANCVDKSVTGEPICGVRFGWKRTPRMSLRESS